MTCCIDDIVKPSHNIEVSVLVKVARIACCVVSWGLYHIFLNEGTVVVVKRTHKRRRHR
jgi:hypothetical protein